MWLVPKRRTRSNSAGQPAAPDAQPDAPFRQRPANARPRAAGGLNIGKRRDRIGAAADAVQHALRRCGPDAGQQLHDTETGDPITRIFREAQQRQHILDMRGFEKFQTAEFHERDVAAGQLHFERAAVMRCAEQHRLLLQRVPASRFSSTFSTT